MITSEERNRPDDPRLLIPWYVRGTLSPVDRRRVEQYLAEHPDAARELDAAREEMLGAIESNEATPVRTHAALRRIMDEVGRDAAAAPVHRYEWREWLGSFLSPRGLLVAALAVLTLAVVEAGIIATLISQPEEGFQTAGGPEAAFPESGPTVLVAFAEDATAAEISTLLQSLGVEIVSGPSGDRLYRLRLPAGAGRDAILRTLRARSDMITLVLESS